MMVLVGPPGPSPPEVSVKIQVDITDVAGPKLADLRNIGIVPDSIDGGRDLHVSNPSGSRIVVRDYSTDETIVSGNGWSNAMQALADHYQLPVQVSRDYGVTGGKSGKVLGLWTPATDAPTATPALGGILPAPKPADGVTPALVGRLDAPLASELKAGDLLHIADGEFAPVLGVAVTDRQRVVITWGDQCQAHKLSRGHNEVVLTVDPASIRLTKAQAALLRAVQAGLVSHRPSNAEWAPGYARRAAMFELFGAGRGSNRTLAGNALDTYGLIAYNPGSYHCVELTEPAKAWLAAHPV